MPTIDAIVYAIAATLLGASWIGIHLDIRKIRDDLGALKLDVAKLQVANPSSGPNKVVT